MNQKNTYLIKALDNYPYNLEETVASLNFALSYDPKDTHALCLQGRIEVDVYQNYEAAIECYQEALGENVNATFIYPHFSLALILNEDYEKAHKLIDFALTIKALDKGLIYTRKVYLLECQREYEKALEVIKLAKKHCYDDSLMDDLNDFKKRIKSKMPKKKKDEIKNSKPDRKEPEPQMRKWFWSRKK